VTSWSRIARRVGAIFAGFLAVAILSTAADAVMHGTGVFPPAGQPMAAGLWVLALAYRFAFGVVGGYITARLAPDRPMAHALVLGVIGTILSVAGAVATWDRGPGFGPRWYPLLVIAIALPGTLTGGRLASARLGADRNREAANRI